MDQGILLYTLKEGRHSFGGVESAKPIVGFQYPSFLNQLLCVSAVHSEHC